MATEQRRKIDFKSKIAANSAIVFREEGDDWAILFDPDTGDTFGVDPVGVLIWKYLDGRHTVNDISLQVRKRFHDAPDEVDEHIEKFIQKLLRKNYADYKPG